MTRGAHGGGGSPAGVSGYGLGAEAVWASAGEGASAGSGGGTIAGSAASAGGRVPAGRG